MINKSFWSLKEDKYLIQNYPKTYIDDLCKKLKRSRMAIYIRRHRLIAKGKIIKDKRSFFSDYWKNQYKFNKSLVSKHKSAIKKVFENKKIQKFRILKIKEKFANTDFRKEFINNFIKRRNSKSFREKQSIIASEIMKKRHSNPSEHKQLLKNLRKNPSNQQLFVANLLREVYGKDNVGCNDWNILDNQMEVDIPIYPLRIAIEWDGKYWHSKIKDAQTRDLRKNKALLQKGWKVVRILARSSPQLSNKEISNNFKNILSAIQDNKPLTYIQVG